MQSVAKETKQTIEALEMVLKTGTRHIAFLNSHFFNVEEIGNTRYRNLFCEMVNAIVELKHQEELINRTLTKEMQVPVHRAKRKAKWRTTPKLLVQTTNSIDMTALPGRAIKKGRKRQRRRSQGYTKDTSKENETR